MGGHVFWTDVAKHKGWRVQHNKVLKATRLLKPYRLIGPNDVLWASADTSEEMTAELPDLIDEFSKKTAMLDPEDAKAIARALASALVGAVGKQRSSRSRRK